MEKTYGLAVRLMSFLESSANSTSKSAPAKENKEPKSTPPKRERTSGHIQPSKNKWSVDLRRKEDVTAPSTKGKVNTANSSNNNPDRKSCTFSNDIFYAGKDELKTINDNDKPILRLWASKSKQNLQNNRRSTGKLPSSSEEDSTFVNGSCSDEKDSNSTVKQVKLKTKYVSSPTQTHTPILNKNNLTEEKQNNDDGVENCSKYGRSNGTYVSNNDNCTNGVGGDTPVKTKTATNKLTTNNLVTADELNGNGSGEYTGFPRESSPEIVKEWDTNGVCDDEAALPEKQTRGKGNHPKRKKSKGILEYTHLNFLKSKKNCKNNNEGNYSHKGLVIENGIVDHNITPNGNREDQDTCHIDSNNKYDLESGCINNKDLTSPRREIKSNGSQNSDEIINADVHPSRLNGLFYQANANVNLSCESLNNFNIRARPSFLKKNENDRQACKQKLFVKSCDISLNSDNDDDDGEDIEKLQHATRSLLDNLNWDPTELSGNHENSSLHTVNSINGNVNGHHEDENEDANFEKALNHNDDNSEVFHDEELIKNNDNTTEEMSSRANTFRTNTTSHQDDKTETHKRLIRTSVTQIEKPILHSRRLSDTQVSNNIRRKYSTDLERISNRSTSSTGSYNSSGDISIKRPYVRSQTQIRNDLQSSKISSRPHSLFDEPKFRSDNNKGETPSIEIDDFKSSFLRQRLKETQHKPHAQYSSETSRYSFSGQLNSRTRDDKVDAFIRAHKERRKSESIQSPSKDSSPRLGDRPRLLSNCDKQNLGEVQQKGIVNTDDKINSSPLLTSRTLDSTAENGSVVGADSETKCLQERTKNLYDSNSDLILKLGSENRYSYRSRGSSNASDISNKSISPTSSTQNLDTRLVNDSDSSTMTSKSSILTLPSFGSITKVQPSRLSDVKELQSSFSSRRREKLRKSNSNSADDEDTTGVKCIVEENTNIQCEKDQQTSAMECSNSGPSSPTSTECKADDKRGFFSSSKRESMDGKTKSSYLKTIKDKIKLKKDGSGNTDISPPLSPTQSSFDQGKDSNENLDSFDGDTSRPLSPSGEGSRPRRGSKFMRLFTKSIDTPDVDSDKRNRKLSDSEDKRNRKLSDSDSSKKTDSNEPTRIKTKLKYIESDVKGSIMEEVTSTGMTNLDGGGVMSTSTKTIQNDDKVTSIPPESEVPDKMSSVDPNSTTNDLEDFKTAVKTDRRSRRRDRRNLGLNVNDIDSALATSVNEKDVNSSESVHSNKLTQSGSVDVVPMETNQSEPIRTLNSSLSNNISNENNNTCSPEPNSLFHSSLNNQEPSLETVTNNSSVVDSPCNIEIKHSVGDDGMFDVSTPDNDTFFLSPDKDDGTEYHSDTSTKGHSANKERIKNRKAARLEAAERRRQLNQCDDLTLAVPTNKTLSNSTDSIDTSSRGGERRGSDGSANLNVEKQSPPAVSPKKRKKHKAVRSNTEFINIQRSEPIEIKAPSSQDDDVVIRRNNRRGNQRKERTRTLDSGIDADVLKVARQMAADDTADNSGVVQEQLSFADIKKKLLEGVTKPEEKEEVKEKEKVSAKNRQKIKRTKSTKRYKTITEGIAPRDLELAAQQAKEASNQANKTIDKETLEQITASLSLATDKRKSFRVESRQGSMHQSTENIRLSDGDIVMKDDSAPQPTTLHRTKSMTTLNFGDMQKDKDDDDDDEPEIKPLSEVRNRFLQAMEATKKKHLENKTPIDIQRKPARGDRVNRPHTICGMDDWTMDKLIDDIGATPDNDLQKENKENIKENESINKRKSGEVTKEDVLCNDILNLASVEGISDSELDALLQDDEVKEKEITPENVDEIEAEPLPEVDLSELSDLDFIAHQTTQLKTTQLRSKRDVRPQRRTRAGHNPIKSLQQREDLIDESTLTKKDAENATKSLNPVVDAYRGLNAIGKGNPADRMLKRTDLAEEAVNALRATVDFSKTKLKKVVVAPGAVGVVEESFKPTEITNILMQIKGRRKVQTSVVKFSVDSLNSNDCFIVLTPKDLLCWYGAQCNVIERAKAAEVASRLIQKKEMGCKAFDLLHVEQSGEVEKKLVRVLGGDASTKIDSRKPAINDEDFEKTLSAAYMTYIVCERNDPPELIPLDSQCHRMPSKEILQTDSAFVFDFVHEVYVWLGRKTNSAQRGLIQKLAAQKFDEGYHKLNMEHNMHHGKATARAISTLNKETGPHLSRRASSQAGRRSSLKTARRAAPDPSRPKTLEKVPREDFAILCQLFEGSEWVVFKEKFCDWPDESRIIRMKGGPETVGEVTKEVSTEIVISAADAKEMVKPYVQPKMILEQIDIGRGRGIPKGMDGYHIATMDLKTWHVCENQAILMPDESFGQFHSGEGYVIRWLYKIIKVRNLRNSSDIAKAGGMERCCYFFWLGNDCSVNEEGATAVMTIELDKEKGPQKRCVLGKEPSALLNLFDGGMVIHAGKRPVRGIRARYSDDSVVRLYCVRNEIPSEACLLQVPPFCESLRSRSSFVLLVCQQGEVLLWHGCRTNEGTRATAEHAARQLMANHPEEASIAHITELGFTVMEEGEEPDAFWQLLGGKEDYGSLLEDAADTSKLSPRLFQLESTTGTFLAHEIVSPAQTDLHNCPFPVLQDDLYNVDQPAVFILDAITHIYVWFGWWPDDIDVEASNSRRRRWNEERRKAMESAVEYAKELDRPLSTLYGVYAGLEPESFIEMFPYWVVQEDITDLQIDEGVEEDKLYKITEELAMFTKEFYSITELRASTTPQGVDPTKLEKYLSDEDFLFFFGFTKEAFYTLPAWQQTNWKKKLGLY